jgi:DNA-binding NarL/FixJ family response regulator
MIGDGETVVPPKVLIVEDHELLSELLVLAFRDGGIDDVTVAGPDGLHLDAVLALADDLHPDVVLLDLHLGRAGSGISHIGPLVTAGTAVLIMTASDDPVLLGQALEAGAAGIFSKMQPFESLADQVRDAARGDTVISAAARARLLEDLRAHRHAEVDAREPFEGLTGRERVVLAGLVRGTTAEQIAVEEHVTLATVRSQIRGVLRKLGVNSQLLAVAMARGADWTGPDTN